MYLLFHRSHSASTAGYTNRFHPTRFAGPGIDRNRSPNALLTGIQHNGFGPQAVQPLHGGLRGALKWTRSSKLDSS